MIFAYEGTDVTADVTIDRCVYEARESGALPWLSVEFDDDAGLWDRWAPQPGDAIEVTEEGVAATGVMYVERVEPRSGGYAIDATALPVADARAVREWRDTTLFAVAGQLAGAMGLKLASHGGTDMSVSYARQDDEPAAAVLSHLAALSGFTIDVHDGTLHLCAREWVEAQPAAGVITIGDDSDYAYSRKRAFSSCSLTQPASGLAAGIEESYGSGEPRFFAVLGGNVAFPGSSELKRACAGMLAYENARRSVGYVRGSSLSPFSPGATCAVACDRTPSLAGSGVVTRVRNDFADGTSKTWWRAL